MAPHLLGRMLRGFRAGARKLAWNDPAVAGAQRSLVLSSGQFSDGGLMPLRCAGKGVGDNISPSLSWSGVPAEAEELILIMEDPDAPLLRPVVHLIATGITPETRGFAEGGLSVLAPDTFRFGIGSCGKRGYQGPRPVSGHGPHRYIFTLLAIRPKVTFSEPPTLATTLAAIDGRVLAKAKLVGLYER
jgi:Raf kinase inhibitor-like YbhB/YbcL family protein